jgi:hypothetical protein
VIAAGPTAEFAAQLPQALSAERFIKWLYAELTIQRDPGPSLAAVEARGGFRIATAAVLGVLRIRT